MKKALNIFAVVVFLGAAIYLFSWLGKSFAGGGGADHLVPDTAKAGEPIVIGLILSTWGEGDPIHGRYANIVLNYGLVGTGASASVQATPADLPENYRAAMTETSQYEKYEFVIPPYPKGISGEVAYSLDMIFDGEPSHTEGVKMIKLVAE